MAEEKFFEKISHETLRKAVEGAGDVFDAARECDYIEIEAPYEGITRYHGSSGYARSFYATADEQGEFKFSQRAGPEAKSKLILKSAREGIRYVECFGRAMNYPYVTADKSVSRVPIAKKFSDDGRLVSMELVQVKAQPDLSSIEKAAREKRQRIEDFAEWHRKAFPSVPESERLYKDPEYTMLYAMMCAQRYIGREPGPELYCWVPGQTARYEQLRQQDRDKIESAKALARGLDFEPIFEAEKHKIFNTAELSYKRPWLGFIGGGWKGLGQIGEEWDFCIETARR
jgi:hypothetical protein